MKTWYKIVCDEHKEYCDTFVRGNFSIFDFSKSYLGDNEKEIVSFLERHSECNLRCIHRDEELDYIFENKYTKPI